MRPGRLDALLAIDLQEDFLPGGALAVADRDAVIARVTRLGSLFADVLLTQDWHPRPCLLRRQPSRPRAVRSGGDALRAAGAVADALRPRHAGGWSALDARTAGFEALMVEDACRAIDACGSLAPAWEAMTQAGVGRLDSAAVSAARAP